MAPFHTGTGSSFSDLQRTRELERTCQSLQSQVSVPPEWLQFLSVAVAAAVGECCVEKDCRTMTVTISDWRRVLRMTDHQRLEKSSQDDFDCQQLEKSGQDDLDHQRLEKSGQDDFDLQRLKKSGQGACSRVSPHLSPCPHAVLNFVQQIRACLHTGAP